MTTTDYATKIAALLAKAESSTHDAEAKLYRDKAQDLMLKWGIDDAMIADANKDASKVEAIIRKTVQMRGQWHMGLFMMGQAVAEGLGNLKVFITRMDSNNWTNLIVVGHESDVARYITLVESLKIQAEAAMKDWWKAERKTADFRWMYDTNTGWTARRQFIISFGTGVKSVLRTQRHELVSAGSSTDLVLINRAALVDQHIKDNMKIGKASGRGLQFGSGNAHGAGYAAGRAAGQGRRSWA